ncbi:sugar-binding protein [Paenibacillus albus]|uniref:Carbohydrate-binding protein n=1 Tax=Paenibacillus albus TaxID=2495582 RepID=A0A3S9A6I2_9BACL|nr:sugar-binding protein [Paenibacillus albus]AZN41325.1 carbohydrate-binding protein [Paenibacillus albus]
MRMRRRISGFVVLTMLAALFSVFGASTASAYSVPNLRGGINAQWYFGTQAEVDNAATQMTNVGLGWARIDLKWDLMQPSGAGTAINWTNTDKMVSGALGKGMKVMLVASYTPSWANGGNSDVRYYPNSANIGNWQSFLDAAVRRYLPQGVTTYEMWNEPNYSPQSSPSLFVSNVLIPGANAVRAVSNDLHIPVTIVNGAAANLIGVSGIVDPYDWVTGIYAAGGKNYFDVQGIHPYCWPLAPSTADTWNALLRAPEIHTIMSNNGDGAKQIWATEFGYPTHGPNTVTEQQQSDYIVSALQIWSQSAWQSWTGPMFLYTYRDDDGGVVSNDPEQNFGLMHYDRTTFKPIMSNLLSVMQNVAPPPPPATSGWSGSTLPRLSFNASQTATAPTIDGSLDSVWTGKVTNAISKVSLGTISGSSDLSGNFGALWDSTNLYIVADINDDSLRNDSAAISDDDSIDLYLDLNHDRTTTYGADDFMYQFGYGDTTFSEYKHSATAGVTFATTARTGGYRIEIKIPWTTLGKTPTTNMAFGFDMMINDDDDGGARDSQLAWNDGTANAYQNPSLFGDGTLVAAAPTGGTIVYEAENGTYGGGGQQQTVTNASNGKVVGNLNTVGAFSQVGSVDGGSGGNASLVVRYANGNSGNMTLSLYANGTKLQQLSFAPTGSWNTFADTSAITVPLNAGTANTIKIQRDSTDTPAADIDKFTVTTTSSSSSAVLINGFENSAQWSGEATRTVETTLKTQGSQSLKFHYTVPTSGWANGNYAISSPFVDIGSATSLKLDVYPTTQTPTGQTEPITLKIQDQTGGVIYEDRLPRLTANQWNTVTISLLSIPAASRHQINSVNMYVYSGFTAQLNGRTTLDYYFDNLRTE